MAVTERDAGIRTSMVPPPEVLPDVLPTDRLGPTGKPIREIRDGLRRIDDPRNVGSVLLTWGHAAVRTCPSVPPKVVVLAETPSAATL